MTAGAVPRPATGKIAGLTGLRGVAILLVVAFHVTPERIPFGSLGVTVFFVLSGYLMTRLLLAERERNGRVDFRAFYMRRVLRLAPALVFAVTVTVLAMWLLRDPQMPSPFLKEAGLALLYLSDFAWAFGVEMPALAHTWSLSVEEQFYLVWPALLLALLLATRGDARRLRLVIFSMTAAALAWRVLLIAVADNPDRVYFAPDTNAYALLLGCSLAVWPDRRAPGPKVAWATTALAVLLAVLPVSSRGDDGLVVMMYLNTAAALVAVLMVKAAPRAGWLLSNRPLVWIGEISYGWYIWHQLLWHVHPFGYELVGRNGHAIAAVLALIPTWISYRYVEMPALRLKERFSRGHLVEPARPDVEPVVVPDQLAR